MEFVNCLKELLKCLEKSAKTISSNNGDNDILKHHTIDRELNGGYPLK